MPELYAKTLADMPLGRFGSPEEVATAMVFLSSPMAAYITGTNLVVDGGYTKRVQF
jgi:3-oxoacyl-[acyl-carrier protein] reductase